MPDPSGDYDEDEALRQANAMSLEDQSQGRAGVEAPPSASLARQNSQPSLGLLDLDRKGMEQERLARLAAKRSLPDADAVSVSPAQKKQRTALNPLGATCPAPTLSYPDGVVKRTWAYGYARTGDDIKIEEILHKDKLLLALLSSFQWDEEWILSKLDMPRTKVVLAAFAADDGQKEAMRANSPANVKFCFPQMHGPGSMHSKLQLLKYSDCLRIVVPTGNLVPHDWGETGVLENMVFLIDLPRLGEDARHQPTMFSRELERFLQAMGVDDKMVNSLSNYDFSKTANLGFVYTRPGSHTDDSVIKRVGYCGLGTAMAALGLATTDPVQVDCASLGSIKWQLVEAMYNACQGDDGMKEYHDRTTRKPSDERSSPSQLLKTRFRIYFPTSQTVSDSRGGRAAAGTICMQARWWHSPDFPTELVRDCSNTREGLLMHTKVIFVRKTTLPNERPRDSRQDGACSGWAYVGSANLSESAWGRLVKDRKSGKAKMSCRNWECGVVLPARSPNRQGDDDVNDMSVFDGTIPIPMKVPGRAYGPNEEPWFYNQL